MRTSVLASVTILWGALACGPSTLPTGESNGATRGSDTESPPTGASASDSGLDTTEDTTEDTTGTGPQPPPEPPPLPPPEGLPPLGDCTPPPPPPAGPSCPAPPAGVTLLFQDTDPEATNGTVAVDGEYAYFVTNVLYEEGTVWRVDKCTGEAEAIADSGRNPAQMSLSEDLVVWTDYTQEGAVYAVPKAGGDRVVLSTANEPLTVLARDDYVLWGYRGLYRTPLAGGSTEALLDLYPHELVPVDDLVFFASNTSLRSVGWFSPDDGTWGVLYESDFDNVGDLEVDCDAAWWGDIYGQMVSVPLSGGEPQLVGPTAYRLAQDQQWVYATDGVEGEVWAVPKAGGDAQQLAEGLGYPYEIAVDQTHVYWTDSDDVGLYSMPKPGPR